MYKINCDARAGGYTRVQTVVKILAAVLLMVALESASGAPVAKPVSYTIETINRAAGRQVGHGAGQALNAAFRKHGDGVLDAAHKGGADFVQAGARHGDEFWAMASRVPEVAPHLARNADSLIPLARRHGDEILRLEARLPGMAQTAAKTFPSSKDLRRINALPESDARGLIAYSQHATSRFAARLSLRAVEKQGTTFLAQLNNRQILTGGLSLGIVIFALGAAVAANRAPGEMFSAAADILGPVGISVSVVIVLLGLVLIYWFYKILFIAFRRLKKGQNKKRI